MWCRSIVRIYRVIVRTSETWQ